MLATALVPTLWTGFFLLAIFGLLEIMGIPSVFGDSQFPLALIGVHCAVSLLAMGATGWYMVAAGTDPALDSTMKIVWVLILFQFNIFAMPVYWYLHVWRRSPAVVAASAAPTA